jgi:Folded gastrulation N-terminus
MKTMTVQLTLFCFMSMLYLTHAYPVESKPLNNNPDTWNFGAENWMLQTPWNSNSSDPTDPSASALTSDPHVKKSKITPKSIFIAPNAFNGHGQICPHGYRFDDNGKCIKTVTINQDEVLAARISELFGVDENPNRNSDIDSDYYDFDEETKSEKDSGPLQINLPLAILDIEDDEDGKKVEYVIEEKLVITMRNLNPKDVVLTTEKVEETTTSINASETPIDSESTEESNIISTTITTDNVDEAMTTTTEMLLMTTTSSTENNDDAISTTIQATTIEPKTTTLLPSSTTKLFSVDFMPKLQRKSNRVVGQVNARLKNSRGKDKLQQPRKQKTTAVSTKLIDKSAPAKLEIDQTPKKNRTRSGSKRPGQRKLTTTESPVTSSTQKPFWWLPKGWSIDESKEKPVLVRFWAKQPLPQDERARSQDSRQRMNSKMPTDNIFREITAPELEEVL